jgi:hypothetical protein
LSFEILSTYLNRSIVPTLQGYEDSGDFTLKERLKSSIQKNMTYYAIMGSTGLFGLLLIIIMRHNWYASEVYHACIDLDQSNMFLHLGLKRDCSVYTAVKQIATINFLLKSMQFQTTSLNLS